MVIETGDYFVVTRGFRMGDPAEFAMFWGAQPTTEKREPRYDRSWEGVVFHAEEVAAQMVAARVVAATCSWKKDMIGTVASLNLGELEAMTVTAKYAEACGAEIAQEATDD